MNIKDLIKDNVVEFSQYRNGVLYYHIDFEGNTYSFPVDCAEVAGATMKAKDKAIFFMRFINKALKDETFMMIVK